MTRIQVQQLEPGAAPQRVRELETGRLVVRAVRQVLAAAPGSPFLVERARGAVVSLEPSRARQALNRVIEGLARIAKEPEAVADALVCYGGVLEQHHERADAVEVFASALAIQPDRSDLMLHAARSYRVAGEREAALALYRRVRELNDGSLARFSHLGEALLSRCPEAALDEVLEEAEAVADREVAGVALEERARVRRAGGRSDEAVADYTRAGLRYSDRRDRLRVAHTLADLLLARGDYEATREALGAAAELALSAEERDHAGQRLRAVARAQGDEIGLRRHPPTRPSSLVTLMPVRRASACADSVAPTVRQWRDALVEI